MNGLVYSMIPGGGTLYSDHVRSAPQIHLFEVGLDVLDSFVFPFKYV